MRRMLLSLGAPLLAGCAVLGDEIRVYSARDAEADAVGAASVHVAADAGTLVVQGAAGLQRVRAHGQAGASSLEILEEIELVVSREGDVVVVKALLPERMWGGAAKLDFTVEVPADLAVLVADGSGGAEVRDVLSLDLADSSGDVVVERVAGLVRITDGSGDVQVREVGSLEVTDGSGDVVADGVGGDVVVVDDSGDVALRRVAGTVRITDGSGHVFVSDVGRDVLVLADGSGDLQVSDVRGSFRVEVDGSGSVRHSGVQGEVRHR